MARKEHLATYSDDGSKKVLPSVSFATSRNSTMLITPALH